MVKQEVYPACTSDKDGNIVNGCNKQDKAFNNTLFNGQICGDLTGECDSTAGLSCQKSNGIGKCA